MPFAPSAEPAPLVCVDETQSGTGAEPVRFTARAGTRGTGAGAADLDAVGSRDGHCRESGCLEDSRASGGSRNGGPRDLASKPRWRSEFRGMEPQFGGHAARAGDVSAAFRPAGGACRRSRTATSGFAGGVCAGSEPGSDGVGFEGPCWTGVSQRTTAAVATFRRPNQV